MFLSFRLRRFGPSCAISNWVRESCLLPLGFRLITLIYFICVFFFFFQAEDGIRDIGVTGVQTCALPILDPPPPGAHGATSLCPKGTQPVEFRIHAITVPIVINRKQDLIDPNGEI